MKIVTFIVVLMSTFYCGLSIGASGSTGYVEIQTIRVGGGFLRVTGVSNFNDPSNCDGSGSDNNRSVLIMEGTTSYKEMLSFVLSAKLANKPVQFWLDGCSTDSGNSIPNAKFVYIN